MIDWNFDGQRLAFHPEEVAHWLRNGASKGPLYTELELSSVCNHRCRFCGIDHLVNQSKAFLDEKIAERVIDGLRTLGNKAVMIAGHGEPLLHPQAAEIVGLVSRHMSASVTTNGTALDKERVACIDGLTWIRFSVNAGDPETYAQVHGTKPDTYDRVLRNIDGAVQRKRRNGLAVTIGVQLVLLDRNAGGVLDLARAVRRIGVDYFSVKPYSQHPMSRNLPSANYEGIADLQAALADLETETFRVVFRAGSFRQLGQPKTYGACYGTDFLAFVCADGTVWECNVHVGDERFFLGNLRDESLVDIWRSARRRRVLDFVQRELDLRECRDVCRMEGSNQYLWRLRHPQDHDDFV